MVTFGLAKPPVDAITGLSPSISVDQHLTNHSPRSTVGTATEVYTYLRVLFARLGHRPCPVCGRDVSARLRPGQRRVGKRTGGDEDAAAPEETFPCPHCGAPVPEISMAHFSFNKPEGACPTCTGLGTVHQANLKRLVDEQKSLAEGAVAGLDSRLARLLCDHLARLPAHHYGFEFDLSLPVKDYPPAAARPAVLWRGQPALPPPLPGRPAAGTVRQGRFEGIATNLLRRYAEHLNEHVNDEGYRDKLDEFLVTQTCPDCAGTRLRPESRAVTRQRAARLSSSRACRLADLGAWLDGLPGALSPDEMLIAEPILTDLQRTHCPPGRGRRRVPVPGPRPRRPSRPARPSACGWLRCSAQG